MANVCCIFLLMCVLSVSHTNLSFPWQPTVTGATPNMNVFVHACVSETETERGGRDRKRDGEGGRERERVIE